MIDWIIKSERDGMNMSDAITLNYYNSNAAVFSETTKNVDFSEVQQIFTNHLSPDASILDFGCGSGRDTKYFLDQGYHVTATDGSEVICKMATDYTGIQVKQILFEEFARQISGLQIEKMWITGDVREGRGDERWLNILLRKEDIC